MDFVIDYPLEHLVEVFAVILILSDGYLDYELGLDIADNILLELTLDEQAEPLIWIIGLLILNFDPSFLV